jgi:glutaconate CoA-transferase subunit B
MPFHESDITVEEYLSFLISREVRDREITGVGTLSPVPLIGALLARKTHAPLGKLIVLGDEDATLVDGSKELFDLAQRGRLDLFFLSGAQIDGKGNINLTCIGEYDAPRVRLPGGAGSAMLSYMSRRTILFAMNHDPRVFVEKVDFITSRGDDSHHWRRGRVTKVVTPLCVFSYNPDRERLEVASIHRGVTAGEIENKTGFDVYIPQDLSLSPLPREETIQIIRNEVLIEAATIYPLFVRKLDMKISALR